MSDSLLNARLTYLPMAPRSPNPALLSPAATAFHVETAYPATFAEILSAKQGTVARPLPTSVFGVAPSVALGDLRISGAAHATLQTNGVVLNAEQIARLKEAIGRAAGQGAANTLVLMDDLALVVSVPGKTVVTIADKAAQGTDIVTKIDSAVFA